jgi:hypothetical protein
MMKANFSLSEAHGQGASDSNGSPTVVSWQKKYATSYDFVEIWSMACCSRELASLQRIQLQVADQPPCCHGVED